MIFKLNINTEIKLESVKKYYEWKIEKSRKQKKSKIDDYYDLISSPDLRTVNNHIISKINSEKKINLKIIKNHQF